MEVIGRNHKFRSSVDGVLSNDDLLIEILLGLPIFSLHLFKSVCKHWLCVITSPSFILRRTRILTIDPPSGLLFGRRYGGTNEYNFVSFDPRITSKRSILLSCFDSKAHIVQSCNGLLLCRYSFRDKYSIYNPLVSMFKMLPPIHDLNYERKSIGGINIAFDPTRSPSYKVVHVGSVEDVYNFEYSVRIQTYSADDDVWSVWDDRMPSTSFHDFSDGIYWNGVIHWLSNHERSHVKLDIVDRPVLTNMQTPLPLTVKWARHSDRRLYTSHGSLLLLCKNYARSRHLNIYEMKTGYSEWLIKYFVNVDDMLRPFPTLRMPDDWDYWHILSIVLGEMEDSFIVIELSGILLQYKFLLETASELFDLGDKVTRCDEFIASFAHL